MTSVSVSVLNLWPSSCNWRFSEKVILDDAVVDHHDVARAIAVRVRILFGGTSVRGPARVADAEGAFDRSGADGLFQVAQFAGGAANREFIALRPERRCPPNRSRDIPASSPSRMMGTALRFPM